MEQETRLTYTIKACSTEAPGYPAENLQELVSTGWRSADLCDFPQSIICKLEIESQLKKIQLLGHNYLIPQRVVLYVGNFNNKYEKHIWKKIGFVTFSDNGNTNYRQRELKTINLRDMDVSGQYIKFEVYQNHSNKKNIFNQVAIDAINFMGQPRPDRAKEIAEHYLKKAERENQDPNIVSPTFSTQPSSATKPKPETPTGIDDDTQSILDQMKEEKRNAEDKEDFDLAAALKVTLETVTVLGQQIWLCDREKKRAVTEERYDEAKGFKLRRDEMRLRRDRQIDENLYQFGLGVDYFGDRATTVSSEATTTEDNGYLEVKSSPSPEKKSVVDFELDNDVPHYRYDVEEDVEEVPVPNNDVSYDERQIGAHHKTFDQLLAEELEKEKAKGKQAGEEAQMDDKSRRENQAYISVFGEKFVTDAIAKKHVHRVNAVDQMRQIILAKEQEMTKEEQRDWVRACVHFVVHFLQDGVKEVFLAGLELVPLLVHSVHQSPADVALILEATLPILLKRSGEGVPSLEDARSVAKSSRVNEILEATVNLGTLESVARSPLYYMKTFAPFATETKGRPKGVQRKREQPLSPKQTWARLEIVYKIIRTQQTLLSRHWKTDQLFENTFTLIEIGLKHSNSCVREKAKELLKFLYRVNDERTREMFDAMVAGDKNNKQIREKIVADIIDDFDRIDGKPTKKELEEKQRQMARDEEARKEAQVAELQRKLAEAKALTKAAEESKQAGFGSSPHPASGNPTKESVVSESMASVDESNDKTCIFCGEFNENFDGPGLDVHYWKHCPMLKRCERCKMVVEISGYSAHLLDECEQRDAYVECNICGEAVLSEELEEHQANSKVCFKRKEGKAICTLCHEELDDTEQAWRDHLMGANGCLLNKRRTGMIFNY